MCSCTGDAIAEELVSVNQDVAQVVVQTKLQEAVTGTGDRPSVFVMMIDDQASAFSCDLKLLVVVGITTAAILDALHMVVIVNHLMKKSCCNLFDGAGPRTGADVDFMGSTDFGNPGVLS